MKKITKDCIHVKDYMNDMINEQWCMIKYFIHTMMWNLDNEGSCSKAFMQQSVHANVSLAPNM